MTQLIGITGLIGSGKTTLAHQVAVAGYPVIDADREAHHLYATDTVLRQAIGLAFGAQALIPGGVDRAWLAARVFTDSQELSKLEHLVHPALLKHIDACIHHLEQSIQPPPAVIFLDAALLYKWPHFIKRMARIWVVNSSEEVRVQRLIRRGLTESDARHRIEVQRQVPVLQGDNVESVVNDSSMDDFVLKIQALIKTLPSFR